MIDLSSDDYFMSQALRQAVKAYEADEVPVGAVSKSLAESEPLNPL